MLVLGRNLTCTAGGEPREFWGEDHYVTSIHIFSSAAVNVYRYAQLVLCLSLIPEYVIYTIVTNNSKSLLKYVSCVLNKKCFYLLLVLPRYIHLLLKSNTAIQVDSNFHCFLHFLLNLYLFPTEPELFHSTTAPDSDFVHYGNSSYLIIPSKMNWEEARKACKEKSSELASVFDYYSNIFLLLQAAQYGEPLWIGLNSNVVRLIN